MVDELRVTTSIKIKQSIRDKFKVYCIQKKVDMSELLEKLMEKEMNEEKMKSKEKKSKSKDFI